MKLLHRLSALAMTAVMAFSISGGVSAADAATATTVSYTHLRDHETDQYLV